MRLSMPLSARKSQLPASGTGVGNSANKASPVRVDPLSSGSRTVNRWFLPQGFERRSYTGSDCQRSKILVRCSLLSTRILPVDAGSYKTKSISKISCMEYLCKDACLVILRSRWTAGTAMPASHATCPKRRNSQRFYLVEVSYQ